MTIIANGLMVGIALDAAAVLAGQGFKPAWSTCIRSSRSMKPQS